MFRLEDFEPGAGPLHGVGGPLQLSNAKGRHFLCEAFGEAARDQLGIRPTLDHNSETDDAGYYHVTVSRGHIPVRVSSAAYLRDARRRPNLRVITGAQVRRVVFEGRRAIGVIYELGEQVRMVAGSKVVLSAGVIGSPQLLQLSGVGDPGHLTALGIEVIHPQPSIGENLQDHLQTWAVYRVNVDTFNNRVRTVFGKLRTAFEGLLMQTGAYYGVTNYGMFVRTQPGLTRPDAQFHVFRASGSSGSRIPSPASPIGACQLRPESRGSVMIKSRNHRVSPTIKANYLDSELDRQVMVGILKICRQLARHPKLHKYIVEERSLGPAAVADDDLLTYVRNPTQSPPITRSALVAWALTRKQWSIRICAFVASKVSNVVDASIMPTIISGNTNIPKFSDMIIRLR